MILPENDNSDNLSRLKALAEARQARGDHGLELRPTTTSEEESGGDDNYSSFPLEQGLVIEPNYKNDFRIKDLAHRRRIIHIGAFCDGIRSTYSLGFEQGYPLMYTRNAAAVRTRNLQNGFHTSLGGLSKNTNNLLAPFGLLDQPTRAAYEGLGLLPNRYSDLCWNSPGSDEYGVPPGKMPHLSSQDWQKFGRRRARRLLDLTEQQVALAAARVLRTLYRTGDYWLLKDGSLFQFEKNYLRLRDPLRMIVGCVKTHPVSFFGAEGERLIASLKIGQRSVAFVPRPFREARQQKNLNETLRPIISWYLRVSEPNLTSSSQLSGIVRLDIAATSDWHYWIDLVSWAVLDEFFNLSARPDPRYDVMPYGIFECEKYLKAHQLPAHLLLARLLQ